MSKNFTSYKKKKKRVFGSFLNSKKAVNQLDLEKELVCIDDDLRLRIQKELLGMYLEVEEVCRKYGIDLFLVGGSALGAVRHGGFIPWDDDLDVAMTREAYERFAVIFKKELSEKYYLAAPEGTVPPKSRFPKILKKGTLFREICDISPEKQCGLFLDIFIIESIPDKVICRKLKGLYCNVLEFIAGQVAIYEARSETLESIYAKLGIINYAIRLFIGKAFSFQNSQQWYAIIDHAVQYNTPAKTRDCGLPTGRKHYLGEIYRRKDLFPPAEALFEGYKVKIFHNVDQYLRILYGDYWKIPSPEDRERHFVIECKL